MSTIFFDDKDILTLVSGAGKRVSFEPKTITIKAKARRYTSPSPFPGVSLGESRKISPGGAWANSFAVLDDSDSDDETPASAPAPSLCGPRKVAPGGSWTSNLVSSAASKHGSVSAWTKKDLMSLEDKQANDVAEMKAELAALMEQKRDALMALSAEKKARIDQKIAEIDMMRETDFAWGDMMIEENELTELIDRTI